MTLRGVQVACISTQVELSLFTDFESFSTFRPAAHREDALNAVLDQVIAWGGALQKLRDS